LNVLYIPAHSPSAAPKITSSRRDLFLTLLDEAISRRLALCLGESMPDLDRVESLFHQALELSPEVDRRVWLESCCQGDARLFQETWTLLDARTRMSDTTVTSGITCAAPASPRELPIPTAQFGPYRAVKLLGHGGMSAVYLAERADGQFQHTVALKIMAGYLAGPEFLRRFETERQILASLNHHHITRLLDGGLSSAGEPFLITEYVDGQPIDRYCDQGKLDVKARLRIFLQVCDAVTYAHRNLIVHRDLKPANILVNEEGAVKLLDFGTASLLAGDPEVPVTRIRMLTPRYASPEQLRGERVNIATDIFSLGVILYELLTGAWPFGDPNSILRELDRSTRDVTATPLLTAITEKSAESRSASREHLGRALDGDLSAVVLKAIEYDPSRRYDSARALAADLESFLDERPVAARPQTAAYRARKFLRRRWLPVGAAAVFVLGLAAAAIVAVYQARVARAEALNAERVNEFLYGMLSEPTRLAFDAQKFTVAEMLEAAETRLENSWKGDALTEATLRQSLGAAYWALARFDRAEPELRKSLAIFQTLGDEKEAASTLYDLSSVAGLEGRPEEEVKGLEQVLVHLKHLGKQAPPQLIFSSKNQLATTLWLVMHQRLPEARDLLDEAIALGGRDSSISRMALASAMSHRAGMLGEEGKIVEAEAMYRNALAIGRREDPDGYWQAYTLHFLAAMIAPRDLPAATELARECYQVCERNLGPDSAETAAAKLFWMRQRAEARNPSDAASPEESAEPVLEAVGIVRKHYRSSMNLWVALASAVGILNREDHFKEAESLTREMLTILDANHLGETDTRRAQTLFALGRALLGEKKDREAAEPLKKSAAIYDAAGPAGAAQANLARKLLEQGASASRSQ
jgi:eukaryotic-like serine/threonine-protein kinase